LATKEAGHLDPLAGLWYPIIIAGVCFVIGTVYIKNKPTEFDAE
jgi:MHS family proline/betaine transporter-like MFS transporter